MPIPPFGSAPTPDATSTVKGKLQLTGDLAGTSASPTVVDLSITSEAEGDILYRNATNWVRLPKGTAAQQLRINAGATAPEWATISAGGQTTYDAIVAPSGGDYTTLGAAIAAASNGWSIFVKEGTYSESAISTALTNLTIAGENPKTAIIALTTVACVFSGANVQLRNIGFTASTGYLHMTGAEANLTNVRMNVTDVGSTTASFYVAGARSFVTDCYVENTLSSGTPGRPTVRFTGDNISVKGNYFKIPARATSAAVGGVYNQSTNYFIFSGNTVESNSNVSGGIGLAVGSGAASSNISGNQFVGFDVTSLAIAINVTGSAAAISGNVVINGRIVIDGTDTVFSGNYVNMGASGSNTVISCNSNSARAIIVGNKITTGNSSGVIGVNIAGTVVGTQVVGNKIYVAATGVTVAASTCTDTQITGNHFNTFTTAVNDSGTGTTITANRGNTAITDKVQVYMKNTSGSTINAGNVVTLKAVAAGDEVTTTTAASDALVFGVATAAISNNAYGYIQVSGKTTLLTVNGTTDIAVGDFLTTYTSAGIAKKAAAAVLGVTLGDIAFAIALEAYTTDDSNGVIDALIIEPRRL